MNKVKVISTLVAALLAGACTLPVTMTVPKNLQPEADEKPAMLVYAKGVQIYECRVKAGSGEVDWVFVAPEAELIDVRGKTIGRHGAGPFWEHTDGSAVKATVKERAEAPVAGAIPWLLLTAKPYGPDGKLARVSSIQRLNTAGGVAPRNGCDRTKVGTPVRVAYTADYMFFAR